MPHGAGRGPRWGDFSKVAAISFNVVLLIAGGAVAGVFLDRKFGTKPAFSLALLFLGLAAAAWYAYKSLTEMIK